MPCCNGADRGCNITPRESGQTSLWSGVTREPGQQTSGGDADLSAAATLAGAVPERGNTVCLLQAGIVKVSPGKRRRPASLRLGRPVVQFWCGGGSRTPPRAGPAVTAHQGEGGSDRLPRGGDELNRSAPAATAKAVVGGPRPARGV